MSEPAENYVSQDNAGFFRAQAVKVWALTAVVVLLWVAVIVLAPVHVRTAGPRRRLFTRFSAIFAIKCPSARFILTGIRLRFALAVLACISGSSPVWPHIRFGGGSTRVEPLPRIWLFLSMVPMAVDWSLGVFGIWENTHLSRFITGLILGAACATFIVPALVEIRRNITFRRRCGRLMPVKGSRLNIC